MSRKMNLLAACVALLLAGTPALAGGNVNFSLGSRSMNESDLEPVDEQTFIGAYVDFAVSDWPIDLAGGIYRSTESDSAGPFDISVTITELSFGAMKTWQFAGNMHPFAGGGLSIVQAEAEVDTGTVSTDESDTAAAMYAEGGVYWRLGSAMNLGAHARFNRGASHGFDGAEVDSDYFQVGVLAGFAWNTK